MKLPTSLQDKLHWNVIGPVHPSVPANEFPTLAVDGGASFVPNIDVWIGDNDSYLEKIDIENAFFFSPDKDLSDLALALKLFENNSYTLHLYGFLGGRRDHELINYGVISHYLLTNNDNSILLYEREKAVYVFHGKGKYQFEHYGIVSIGTLYPQSLTLNGQLAYTGTHRFDPLSSHGLSNKAQGSFEVTSEAPFFVYLDPSHE